MRHLEDIVVTGLGAVSALGQGCAALWSALDQGRGGLRPIQRFTVKGIPPSRHNGGIVQGWNDPKSASRPAAFTFAVEAAREALRDAGLDSFPRSRTALVLGASVGDDGEAPHLLTERLADELEIDGPRITISTACTSSTHAIGLGRDLLRRGEAELVLAGGSESLTPILHAGFNALGVVAEGPCAPFSEPEGMTLGEGAGFLVLENRSHAEADNRTPRAFICGYGLSGDAYHETSPHPRGSGVARAIRNALDDARLQPFEIDYINAHGTGTAANDPAEWTAISGVFGERAADLPISSTKAHLGHAQSAAGVLEMIATLLSMEHGVVPPTFNFSRPRPRSPVDPVGSDKPRPASVDRALCTNSAFGGANCAVVVAGPQGCESGGTAHRDNEVVLAGVGALSVLGMNAEALLDALEAGQPLDRAPLDIDPPRLLRRADPRSLDPAALHLSTAAALALQDAGVSVRGALRERAGLVVGTTRPSASSLRRLQASVNEHGLAGISTSAFARAVLNASQGTCAKLLSLKGPQTTVSVGRASGLFAVILAAELLASRDDADLILAGGVDEVDRRGEGSPAGSEGAACVVLGRGGADLFGETPIRVAGWALGGPATGLEETIERAQKRAGIGPADVDRAAPFIDPEPVLGDLPSWPSAAACVAAAVWLRARPGATVVVADPGEGSLSCALVLSSSRKFVSE